MRNEIFVRRQRKVIINKGNSILPDVYLATALKNVESLGFTFSQELIVSLRTLSVAEFEAFYKTLVPALKKMVGAHVAHQPMYSNFPTQVMEASEAELYINAIIHYVGSFVRDVTGQDVTNKSLPVYEKEERFPLIQTKELAILSLGTEEEFYALIAKLIAAKTSISEADKNDVRAVLTQLADVSLVLPETIPLKENLAFVMSHLLEIGKADARVASRYFKTATDVLRLAVSMSDGDVSLATNTRFKKFKRGERRLLLGLLENCNTLTEDMLRYKTRWIRLGEILHPAEYKKRYPKTTSAFDILRNNKTFHTFGGKVERALEQKDIKEAVTLLAKRPGEFARRLDHLLRLAPNPHMVLAHFAKASYDVSTPVLLQLMSHFKHRNDEKTLRVVFPKGDIAKVTAIDNTMLVIPDDICAKVVQIVETALIARFSELPSLGKVTLDAALKDYLVPFSQRSASKVLRTVARGSRFALPEGDVIRFFLWWKEGVVNGVATDRVDIDLSAGIYDENWQYLTHVSYTNLRENRYGLVHSGDITSAPNGASEFIDIDVPKFREQNGRYVVMNLYSFSHQPYCDLPECFAGWMARADGTSGEIFEPATVQDKFDVSANTEVCIPVILDLVEKKVIWTDLALRHELNEHTPNNIEEAKGSVALVGKAMTSLAKPSLYDLFTLHAKARGEIVTELAEDEKPDTVFSVKEGITPFDSETIMADFLA